MINGIARKTIVSSFLWLTLVFMQPKLCAGNDGPTDSFNQQDNPNTEIIFSDHFNYYSSTLPQQWISKGTEHPWQMGQTSQAGGEAPELQLNWTPSVTGSSRLTSKNISVKPGAHLRLRLKQYLHNFHLNEGETAAIEISYDSGRNWIPLWQENINKDIAAGNYEFYIEIPGDTEQMQIGFRFEGNNYNIWSWFIDDIRLEELADQHLEALSITGNTTPSVNKEDIYTVKIRNAGLVAQSDYWVKLMLDNDVELGRKQGIPVAFKDTIEFKFPWTPKEPNLEQVLLTARIESETSHAIHSSPALNIRILPEDIISFTLAEANSKASLPVNFLWNHSLSQTLYPAPEINPAGGIITGIQYRGFFESRLKDKAISVWMGETDLNNMANGWIDPASLQLVFQDTMDFEKGESNVFIGLEKEYLYQGENLVIMVHKADKSWDGGSYFFSRETAETHRSRRIQKDDTPINPVAIELEGTPSKQVPQTTLFFSTRELIYAKPTAREQEETPKELPPEFQELFRKAIEAAEQEQQQKPQQQQEAQQPQGTTQQEVRQEQLQTSGGVVSDGIEITEFIFNETITKLGSDFYYYYFQEWQNPTRIEGLSIHVQEKPVPGMGALVMVKVDGQMVFQSMLRPNVQQVRQAASAAVERTRNYFLNYEQIQEQLDGDDFKGSGIF